MAANLLDTWSKLRAIADRADGEVLERIARAYAAGYVRIEPQIQSLIGQIDALQKAGKLTAAQIKQSAAYKSLISSITRELDDYSAYLRTEITTSATEAAEMGSAAGYALMLAAVAMALGVEVRDVPKDTISRPGDSALDFLAKYLDPQGPLFAKINLLSNYHAGEIADGIIERVGMGLNPRDIARWITDAYGYPLTDSLRQMRTVQLYAYRQANNAVQIENSDVLDGVVWCAELDDRTCMDCIIMHGQVFPVGTVCNDHYNGRCLAPGTIVSGPPATAFVSRRYDGEMITIRTSSGKFLSVTPNHPILTDHGWVAANLLKHGSNVVSYVGGDWTSFGMNPDEYQVPTIVEKIPSSLKMNNFILVPTATENFHGDGIGSNIHVIRTNGFLLNTFNSKRIEPTIKQLFSWRNRNLSFFSSFRNFRSMFESLFNSSNRFLSNFYPSQLLFARNFGHHQSVRVCLSPNFNSLMYQPRFNCSSRDSVIDSKRINAFSRTISENNIRNRNCEFVPSGVSSLFSNNKISGCFISKDPIGLEELRKTIGINMPTGATNLSAFTSNIVFDSVVEITSRTFSGQVYNLQTNTGWYISNGIITHNCAMLPLVKGRENPITQTGEAWFNKQDEDTQKNMMGAQFYDAWKNGMFELSDMTKTTHNDVFGDMLATTPLWELLGAEPPTP